MTSLVDWKARQNPPKPTDGYDTSDVLRDAEWMILISQEVVVLRNEIRKLKKELKND